MIEHGSDPTGTGDGHELEVIGWATCFDPVNLGFDGAERERRRAAVVEYLLAHGARHNIFSAVATGSVSDIRALVAADRENLDKPMDKTNHHRRPLHLAVVKKQRESLATLLDLGADMNATDMAGPPPLDQAALSAKMRWPSS